MTPAIPKFKRQKFLLQFLRQAGGGLSKLDFQKLLFLFHQRYSSPYFEFIPYLYGCYSFQANADLEALAAMGWVQLNYNTIQLSGDPAVLEKDEDEVRFFFSANKGLKGKDLIREVYRRFPYYAINSRMSGNLLTKPDFEKVDLEKKSLHATSTVLFTIGYEGITFEAYINQLIRNDVRLLCDVRNNPLSRKFGFSKSMLSAILPKIGIEYVHIPELGIVSKNRQFLETEHDYSMLFEEYGKGLPAKQKEVGRVYALLQKKKRVALTCFEKDPRFCHRHTLSAYLQRIHEIDVVDL